MRAAVKLSILLIAGLFGNTALVADDDTNAGPPNWEQKSASKTADLYAKFELTGEETRCIHKNRIHNYSVLSDSEVFLRMRGKTHFIASFEPACKGLFLADNLALTGLGPKLCVGLDGVKTELFGGPVVRCNVDALKVAVRKKKSGSTAAE